jgi:hypothetical protein
MLILTQQCTELKKILEKPVKLINLKLIQTADAPKKKHFVFLIIFRYLELDKNGFSDEYFLKKNFVNLQRLNLQKIQSIASFFIAHDRFYIFSTKFCQKL